MVVLGVEMTEDGAGIRTTALEIASTDAWPLEDTEFLVRELRNARRRHAGNGGVAVIGGGGSVERLEDMALNSVIVLDSGEPYPRVYSPSDAGLAEALTAAAAGDVIWLPAAGFANAVTIPAGVTLIGQGRGSVIQGTITGGDGAMVRGLTIVLAGSDADVVFGVGSPVTGIFYLEDCHVQVTNDAGDAAALYSNTEGTIEARGCYLSGESTGGNGWAAYCAAGGAAGILTHCVLVYNTTPVGGET